MARVFYHRSNVGSGQQSSAQTSAARQFPRAGAIKGSGVKLGLIGGANARWFVLTLFLSAGCLDGNSTGPQPISGKPVETQVISRKLKAEAMAGIDGSERTGWSFDAGASPLSPIQAGDGDLSLSSLLGHEDKRPRVEAGPALPLVAGPYLMLGPAGGNSSDELVPDEFSEDGIELSIGERSTLDVLRAEAANAQALVVQLQQQLAVAKASPPASMAGQSSRPRSEPDAESPSDDNLSRDLSDLMEREETRALAIAQEAEVARLAAQQAELVSARQREAILHEEQVYALAQTNELLRREAAAALQATQQEAMVAHSSIVSGQEAAAMAEVQRIKDLANSELRTMRSQLEEQMARKATEEMMVMKADIEKKANEAISSARKASAAASAAATERATKEARAQLEAAKSELESRAKEAILEARSASVAASNAASLEAQAQLAAVKSELESKARLAI